MATVETPPPVQKALRQRREKVIAYGDFIENRLNRTRQQVKTTEIFARLTTLGIAVLGLLLAAAVIDHWISPLGAIARWLFLLALVGGSLWYFVTAVLPFFRRAINPVYAARTIEEHAPTLKNSLVNLLMLRRNGEGVPQPVLEHVEQHAATRLTQVQADEAVDRSRLIKLGYILLGVAAACALYKLVSPKDPFQTVRRVVAPWSGVAAPTIVEIVDVRPGDTAIFTDAFVEVEATVHGLRGSDSVTLYYSTDDGRAVDQAIAMQSPDRDDVFRCVLPAGTDGLKQSVHYHIVAGDARSDTYRVTVNVPPAIQVTQLEYKFPTYTSLEPQTVEKRGDISALEGTEVTITAEANQEIAADSAFIDLNGDGTHDLPMSVEGTTARVSFKLRSDGGYSSYQLRFTNADRHENPHPIRYNIQVLLDQPPEVAIVDPKEQALELPLNGELAIQVTATDRDFRLRQVSLAAENARSAGSLILDHDLLKAAAPGQEKPLDGKYTFRPSEIEGVKVGDTVHFWALARDNKEVNDAWLPNVVQTEKYAVKITEPQENAPPQDQPQDNSGGQNNENDNQPMQGEGQQDENNQRNGEGQPSNSDNKQGEGEKSEGAGGQSGEAKSDEQQPGDADGQFAKDIKQAQELAEKERQNQEQGGGQNAAKPENNPQQNPEQKQGEQGGNRNEGNSGAQPNAQEQNGGGQRDKTGMGEANPTPMGSPPNQGPKPEETPKRNEGDMPDEPQAGENPTGAGEQKGVKNDGNKGTGGQNAENTTAPKSNQEDASDKGMGEKSDETKNGSGGRDMPDGGVKPGPPEANGMGGGARNTPMDTAGEKQEHKADGEKSDEEKMGGDPMTPKGAGDGGRENESKTGSPMSQAEQGVKDRDNKTMDPGGKKDDGQEAKSPSTTKETNSNKTGGEEGDRSGGSDEGGGQSGGAAGTGGAGQSTAADEGSKAAAGKGMGEDSDEAGMDTKADGVTGQSSGDEAGEGSETRSGNTDSGKQERNSGQPVKPQGDPNKAPADSTQGDEEQKPDMGDKSTQGQPNRSGQGQQDPTGSAQGATGENSDSPRAQNPPGDLGSAEANAEFAKKQTDLLLQKFENDAEAERLRKQLDWTPEQLEANRRRMRDLRDKAELEGAEGDAARRVLNNLVGPQGATLDNNQNKDDASGLNEGIRKTLPNDRGGDLLRSFLKERAKAGSKR